MRNLFTSLIISFAVIATASLSFAGDDRDDKRWDRDKKEQSYHSKKDKKHHGKKNEHRHDMPSGIPFKKIIMIVEALEKHLS